MDYTLSNSYATDGGTGNRMHLQAQAIPTAVSDLDMNSVLWELMEVVKAAGLAGAQFDKTVPATYQKLLTALRSAGVFTTPAQFDTSTKVATSAFVQRALGNYQTGNQITTSVVLGAANCGQLIQFSGVAPGQSITLPSLATVSFGSVLAFVNNGTQSVAIVRSGADAIVAGLASGLASVTLSPGDSMLFGYVGGSWFVVSGSVQLSNSSSFSFSAQSNGFQKLPSGLIYQWGQQNVPASTTSIYNFPVTFPTACLQIMGSVGVPFVAGSWQMGFEIVSAVQYKIQNTDASVHGSHWFAIGF